MRASNHPMKTQSLAARVVVTAFLLPFVALMLLMVASSVTRAVRGVWTYAWRAMPCEIVASEVREDIGLHRLFVRYRYEAGGKVHEGTAVELGYCGSEAPGPAQLLANRYEPKTVTRCYVSPFDAGTAVLERGHVDLSMTGTGVPFLVGLGFLLPLLFVLLVVDFPKTSERWGRDPKLVGRALFWGLGGVITLAGLMVTYFMLGEPLLLCLRSQRFTATPCVIVVSELTVQETVSREDGHTTRSVSYGHDVRYRYQVDDIPFEGTRYRPFNLSAGWATNQAAVDRFPEGIETTCFVDPSDPTVALLDRTVGPEALSGAVSLIPLAVGLGILLFSRGRGARPGPPGPRRVNPHTTQAAFMLAWNLFIAVFGAVVLSSYLSGETEAWKGLLVLLPFALIGMLGLWSIFLWIRFALTGR